MVAVFSTIIIAFIFKRFVDVKEHVFVARFVILMVGIDFAFTLPFSVMYAVLIARQEHTTANGINITNGIIRNIFIFAFVSIYPNLICLTILHVIFNMTKNYCIYRQVKKKCPHIIYSRQYFERKLIPQIFNYSVYSFIVSFSSRIINFTDEIVVATFLKVADVTYYSIATNLVTYFEKMIWSGASVFVPYISQLDARGEHEIVSKSFFRGSKYTLLITLYIFCGIYLLGGDFVRIWMGPQYAIIVKPILLVLALAKAITLGQSMAVARFFGTSRHHLLGKLNVVEAVSNLVLSIIFVRIYGMIGVAYGTLIPSCIFNGVLLPAIIVHEYNITFFDYFTKSIIGPLSVFFVTIFCMVMIGISAENYLTLLLRGGVMTLVFFMLSLLLVIDTTERVFLFSRKGANNEA